MYIVLDPKTEFCERLESLYAGKLQQDMIINALFYLLHPLSPSFERPLEDKKKHIENKILKEITYTDLEKQGLVRLYGQHCIPTELKAYSDIKHIIDRSVSDAGAKALSSEGIKSAELRKLVMDFDDLSEKLSQSRKTAAKVSHLHTRGNEILSMRDQRELEDGG